MRQVGYLIGIVAIIAFASHQAFQPSRAGTPAVFVWMGAANVLLALVGVAKAYRDGTLRQWFSVRSGDLTRGFVGAAVLFAGAFAFSKTLTLPKALWLARLYDQAGDPAELRKHVSSVVLAIVITAVAEEIVWRGLVMTLLAEKVGTTRAWVWQAVLYALAHVPTVWALSDPNAGPNPLLPMAALAAGIVWGFMARRFERLLPGMVSHVIFDWTVIMMFRLWGPSV